MISKPLEDARFFLDVEDMLVVSRSEAVNEAVHLRLGATDPRNGAETTELAHMLSSLLEIGHVGGSIRPALTAEVEGLRLAERIAILPFMDGVSGEAFLVLFAVV